MIQTPYLIISSSMTLLKELMDAGVSYVEMEQQLRKANALLFTSTGNSSFLSFKAACGQLDQDATLKLIDPNQEFEERLISGRLLDTYNSYSKRKKPGEEWESDTAAGQASEDINSNLKSTPTPGLYIAFGTGPSTATWARPCRYYVRGFNASFEEGKILTIRLAVDAQDMTTKTPDMGVPIVVTGKSRTINFAAARKYEYKLPASKKGLDEDNPLGGISFHGLVCDAMRDLMKGDPMGSTNAVVLLPNIDVVCQEAIGLISKKYTFGKPTDYQQFVDETLGMFGMTLVKSSPRVLSLENARGVEPGPSVLRFSAQEKALNRAESYTNEYKQNNFQAVIRATDPGGALPPVLKVLKDVYSRIRENMSIIGPYSTFVSFSAGEEDHVEVAAKMTEFGNFPLFQLNTKGAFRIVGDRGLVSKYLFGKDMDNCPPLHPFDKKALAERYEDVFKILGDPGSFAFYGARGAASDPFFGLYNVPEELKRELGSSSNTIPFFRYATVKPNVKSVKTEYEAAFFKIINSSFSKQQSRVASAVAQGILPRGFVSFPADTEERADFYKDLLDSANEQEANIGLSLFKGDLKGVVSSTKKLNVANKIFDAQKFHGPVGQIQHGITKLPGGVQEAMAEAASRLGLKVEVETLPYFHLFNSKVRDSVVGLVVSAPTIIQSTRKQPQALSRFATGMYRVIGVEHSMDSNSASSRFVLTKIVPPQLGVTVGEGEVVEKEEDTKKSNDLPVEPEEASISIVEKIGEEEARRLRAASTDVSFGDQAIDIFFSDTWVGKAKKVKDNPVGYWARTSIKLSRWWNSDWKDMGGLDG